LRINRLRKANWTESVNSLKGLDEEDKEGKRAEDEGGARKE